MRTEIAHVPFGRHQFPEATATGQYRPHKSDHTVYIAEETLPLGQYLHRLTTIGNVESRIRVLETWPLVSLLDSISDCLCKVAESIMPNLRLVR